ncbi:unnamed protein product [Cladocopium goreaui]|uniref:Uncharacterized protein n=1 Tax=Cladocopium goreaui TaxID=2562237 RepID=A0A9P1CM67_9DINO|nr:unnamed protein product [Cladocopium goreaui]
MAHFRRISWTILGLLLARSVSLLFVGGNVSGRLRRTAPQAVSEDDMKVLRDRIDELKKHPLLPIIMVDSMLPGQRLVFSASNPELEDLAEEGLVGVIGPQRSGGSLVGVSAKLSKLSGSRSGEWELKAEHVFKVVSEAQREGTITRAKVEFLHEEVKEEDVLLAEALVPLIEEWTNTLVENQAERYEGQLQDILKDLGQMPPPTMADKLAMWAAALVNPLPALGVALEIRPAVLQADSLQERILIVRRGIRGSIEHVSGRKRLFDAENNTEMAMLWMSELHPDHLPRAITVLSHLTIFPRVARSPTWRVTLSVAAVLLLWRQLGVSGALASRRALQACGERSHRQVAGALEQRCRAEKELLYPTPRLDDLLLGQEARAASMQQGAFASSGSKKDEDKKKKKADSKRKSVSKRDMNAFHSRNDEEVKQIVEHWSQYAHPRAKEFFTTSAQLEEVLMQLAKGTDKSDDPITGPDEKCVYWYGDVTKDDLQAAIRMVKPGEQAESVTYVNRVLAFIFATDDSFEKLMALPKEPFKMSCGDQLCVHLAHISLATA